MLIAVVGRLRPVPYDDELAGRIRELLRENPGVVEKRMFGGVAFVIDGNLAVAASSQGGILVRADPALPLPSSYAAHAEVAVMGGRSMKGWWRVASEHLTTKRQLARWVVLGSERARSLPAKR